MGTKLLLLYLISQMLIADSLGGVTLPSSEFIGKVTPIKPKPLSPSTISSLSSSSSSRACENKNQFFSSPASGAREFSSPLVLTSTSRALPVPKIDSVSLSDVKIPERLREKFVLPKLCCTSTGKTKPFISTPEVTLPNKYPLLSSSSKPSNALPCHSSWDMYASSLNTVSSLSSIKPSPIVSAESLNSRSTEDLCSISKMNYVTEPSAIKLTRFRTTDSLPPLEAGTPSLPEQFSSNTFCPSRSLCSLPDPIRYKSTYLPGVLTPSEMPPLIFRPISYKRADNFNCRSESSNLLVPKTLHSDTNLNSIQHGNEPYLSPYMNPFKPAVIPKTIDPIQLPKQSLNTPLSKDALMAQKSGSGKNLRSHLEVNTGSVAVPFEFRLKQPESIFCLCAQAEPKSSLNSKPYLRFDGEPDFKVKPCTLPKINPPALQPSFHFKNSPTPPLVPILPSSPIIDVLSNRIKSFDCSNSIDGVHTIPIIGDYVQTIERLDTNDLRAYKTFVDSKNVPSLEIICSSFAPKLLSYQHPLFTQGCISKPLYSPPKTPCEPVPSISSETSNISPTTNFPSTISQTPPFLSYVNQSPPSSIGQTTSNIFSSVNDVMSSITQDILSKCKSYLDSLPPSSNIHQRQTYTSLSNPCDYFDFKSTQTLPILPSSVNTQSIESIINSAIVDCIHSPTIDFRTPVDISALNAACHSPEYGMSASQSLPICIPQPTVAVLPPTSLITYSSPQLCPSYLPSPILPSYPIISSPFYMEAPVYKVSSSKKDSDREKLIELMVIAEILNNDENFDWDDLDTLLAFLSLS